MPSLLDPAAAPEEAHGTLVDGSDRGRSPMVSVVDLTGATSSRAPTSAEIDAVIAAAIANAPPPLPQAEFQPDTNRSVTPLMTNLLPSAVGADGRVNLFVGNLPYRVRWQDLKDLFRKAGTVLRADVSLGPDNRSRGYGTVLMGSREDAARAIDRYNGYTWQTRTLEVRPDRLPPEYEPQSHPTHHPSARPGIFPYHNYPPSGPGGYQPFSLPGHLTPQGGGNAQSWVHGQIPSQMPSRPYSGAGGHVMLHPGMGVSPGQTTIPLGTSPAGGASTAGVFGQVPLPISGQNTGQGHVPVAVYPQLAASPLAGSLTVGTTAPPGANTGRRESLTPFAHSLTPPDASTPLPNATSPAPLASRPTSSSGKPTTTTSPYGRGRAPPPGTLGPLPPPMFAGIKPAPSVGEGSRDGSVGDEPGMSPTNPRIPVPPIPQLEGLSHQGAGLGPPNTLHDRVLFMSNLPMSMQWQDLKDMLRPAGAIIRADVATDATGRPRGFGTALFANEADASRAVTMFNEREVAGFKIRATLERDMISQRANGGGRGIEDGAGVGGLRLEHAGGFSKGGENGQGHAVAPVDTSLAPSGRPSPSSSPIAKLPWSLNTSLQNHSAPGHGRPSGPPKQQQTHYQQAPAPSGAATSNFRQSHHPGPIAMPPFPHMDNSNPVSPLHTRGLSPMTPSMPGFVFNAYPETPPVHAHFMSPGGAGPFSPGIPVTSPGGWQFNPFLNAAPGAPVNRYTQGGGGQGGSAALGTPTTQAFPSGPAMHYAGPPGAPFQNISETLSQAGTDSGSGGNGGQDYFANALPDTPSKPLGLGAPGSSGPGVGSSSGVSTGMGRAVSLNAKDRLASTPSWEELVAKPKGSGDEPDLAVLAEKLSLADGSATPEHEEIKRSTSGLDLERLGSGSGSGHPRERDGNGRASMDEQRLGWGGGR